MVDRKKAGIELYSKGLVCYNGDNTWRIVGKPYIVTDNTCSCPDKQHRYIDCKHIEGVKEFIKVESDPRINVPLIYEELKKKIMDKLKNKNEITFLDLYNFEKEKEFENVIKILVANGDIFVKGNKIIKI